MYKGIYQAIDYTSSKGTLSLMSNGILLNENNSKKLIEAKLDFLKFIFLDILTKFIKYNIARVMLTLLNLERFMILKKI